MGDEAMKKFAFLMPFGFSEFFARARTSQGASFAGAWKVHGL